MPVLQFVVVVGQGSRSSGQDCSCYLGREDRHVTSDKSTWFRHSWDERSTWHFYPLHVTSRTHCNTWSCKDCTRSSHKAHKSSRHGRSASPNCSWIWSSNGQQLHRVGLPYCCYSTNAWWDCRHWRYTCGTRDCCNRSRRWNHSCRHHSTLRCTRQLEGELGQRSSVDELGYMVYHRTFCYKDNKSVMLAYIF